MMKISLIHIVIIFIIALALFSFCSPRKETYTSQLNPFDMTNLSGIWDINNNSGKKIGNLHITDQGTDLLVDLYGGVTATINPQRTSELVQAWVAPIKNPVHSTTVSAKFVFTPVKIGQPNSGGSVTVYNNTTPTTYYLNFVANVD